MKGYKRILIAFKDSKNVLKQGLSLGTDEGCWITVVKVLPSYEGDLNLVGIRNVRDVLNGGEEKAEEEIQEVKTIAEDKRAVIKTRIEEGKIHEKILDVAEDERCDLIIMGRKPKQGFWKMFSSNVVNKVMKLASCPVLVVET